MNNDKTQEYRRKIRKLMYAEEKPNADLHLLNRYPTDKCLDVATFENVC